MATWNFHSQCNTCNITLHAIQGGAEQIHFLCRNCISHPQNNIHQVVGYQGVSTDPPPVYYQSVAQSLAYSSPSPTITVYPSNENYGCLHCRTTQGELIPGQLYGEFFCLECYKKLFSSPSPECSNPLSREASSCMRCSATEVKYKFRNESGQWVGWICNKCYCKGRRQKISAEKGEMNAHDNPTQRFC